MDFSAQLDELQQRAADAKAAAQAAASESRDQLRQRIDQAKAEVDQKASDARQDAAAAAAGAKSKWAEMKADAAAKLAGSGELATTAATDAAARDAKHASIRSVVCVLVRVVVMSSFTNSRPALRAASARQGGDGHRGTGLTLHSRWYEARPPEEKVRPGLTWALDRAEAGSSALWPPRRFAGRDTGEPHPDRGTRARQSDDAAAKAALTQP